MSVLNLMGGGQIRRRQWLMIRHGTAARNLEGLIDLFDEPYNRRCLLVTDDKHPADLINDGHIDAIIRRAVRLGKSRLSEYEWRPFRRRNVSALKISGQLHQFIKQI